MRITCMPLSSMQVGVRQQREEARALDRLGQLPLVAGRGGGDARRDDLAGLVDEVLEHFDVLVVDPLHLLGGRAIKHTTTEQRPLPFVLFVLGELAFALAFTSARRRHLQSPSMNSTLVTCSTSFFDRLLFAARKPSSLISVFRLALASSRAWASHAIPAISALILRFAPASSRSDSCRRRNSTAGTPAGV